MMFEKYPNFISKTEFILQYRKCIVKNNLCSIFFFTVHCHANYPVPTTALVWTASTTISVQATTLPETY